MTKERVERLDVSKCLEGSEERIGRVVQVVVSQERVDRVEVDVVSKERVARVEVDVVSKERVVDVVIEPGVERSRIIPDEGIKWTVPGLSLDQDKEEGRAADLQ